MQIVNAIILAGGNSNRFGSPKPFLLFDSKTTFLEKLVNVYLEFGCKKIILVINEEHIDTFYKTFPDSFTSKLIIILNSNTGYGRFYSLKKGVRSDHNSDFCFIQNIDNPFTDTHTLKKLYDNRKENAFVTPVHLNRGGHPILLSGMILDIINKETNIDINFKDFLAQFDKITVDIENDKILANINTPADYEKFF